MSVKFKIIGFLLLVFLLVVGLFFWLGSRTIVEEVLDLEIEPEYSFEKEIIGWSVEGRPIEVYTYGNGEKHLLFVGGIHGGYEWNSVVLAYRFIDYFTNQPEVIPDNLTVSIIPSANPDGVFKVLGLEDRFTPDEVPAGDHSAGRFNASGVDLNRNFDCKWQPESTWRSQMVSAGTAPFSEPEAVAIRDFVLGNNLSGAIFWHSQANAVYASECLAGVLPVTIDIMNAYAKASGYLPVESFDHYEVTGDVEGWLASINIPAITVELKTHETVEWEENLAGVLALFEYFK